MAVKRRMITNAGKTLFRRIIGSILMLALLLGMIPKTIQTAQAEPDVQIKGLWVGDSQEVTAAGVISGTGASGTASVSADSQGITLTLTDFVYSGKGCNCYDNWYAAIFYNNDVTVTIVNDEGTPKIVYVPLTVVLNGQNSITQTGNNPSCSFGIASMNIIDFTGPGSLTVTGGSATDMSAGMFFVEAGPSIGDTNLSGVKVTIRGGTAGNKSYGITTAGAESLYGGSDKGYPIYFVGRETKVDVAGGSAPTSQALVGPLQNEYYAVGYQDQGDGVKIPTNTLDDPKDYRRIVYPMTNLTLCANDDTDTSILISMPAYFAGTLPANTFSRPGTDYVFVRWNTQPDGSGVPYADQESVTLNTMQPVDLYAQWRRLNPAVISGTASVELGENTLDLSRNITGIPEDYAGTVTYSIDSASTNADGCSVNADGVLTSGNLTGTCTVKVTISEDEIYAEKTGAIAVTVKPKTKFTVGDIDSLTYNGEKNTPSLTVKDSESGELLTEDTNYTVSYQISDNGSWKDVEKILYAGNYKAVITGKGNYADSVVEKTFTVEQAPLTIKVNDQSFVYNGQPQGEGDPAYDDPAVIARKITVSGSGLQGHDKIESIVLFGHRTEIGVYDGEIEITGISITDTGENPANDNYSITLIAGTLTIAKIPQDAPPAPTAASRSTTSITLKELAGGEYSKDGTNWTDSRTFTGLSPNTAYTFYQRLKEDATHEVSPSSSASISTTAHVHNWSYSASGAVLTATCANTDGGHEGALTSTLTINKPAHTVYGDGKSAEATVTGSIDGVDTPAVVYQKGTEILTGAPEDAGSYKAGITLGGATASVAYEISRATQAAPAAPAAESRSATSVTLKALAGGEYSKDGTNWTDDRVFTNLNPNTAYTFYQRLKEDGNHFASPSSSVSISTTGHVHNWSYSASGAVLTATCANKDGGHEGALTSTLTINKPAHAVYGDGKSAEATVTGSIDGVNTPAVVYQKGTETLTSAPEDAGSYKAGITLGGTTASVEYEIKKASQAAPGAPSAESVTESSVTLKKTAGYQYSTDGTDWKDSNVFSGLNRDTEYMFYQRIAGDANHEASPASAGTKILTGNIVYTVTEGGGSEYTKKSGKNVTYRIVRTPGNELAYQKYRSTAVDGKTVSEGNLDTKSGSLILTMKSAYLDTLGEGEHSVKVSFEDGSAETTMRIKAAPEPTEEPTPKPTATPRPVPKTGDTAELILWGGMVLLGILGICGVIAVRHRKQKKR